MTSVEKIKIGDNPRFPRKTFWQTIKPFFGLVKVKEDWKKHYFDWGAQFQVDDFGNLFWVWDSGTTGRLVYLPSNFSMSWIEQMDRDEAYGTQQLVASVISSIVLKLVASKKESSVMCASSIRDIVERVASTSKTAGVNVSVKGYQPHDLVWIMYSIVSKVQNQMRTTLDEYDVDGGSDQNAFLGQINFYLPEKLSEDLIKDAKDIIEKAVKSFSNEFTAKVWSDIWAKWNTPVIRVEVIHNKQESHESLQSTSITYSTWTKILKSMDLPNDNDTVTGGTIDIDTFLQHAKSAKPMGREDKFLKQIVDMAQEAKKSGYKEITWG